MQIKSEAQKEGTLLPHYHPAVKRVERIAGKIIQSALQRKGGGYQDHMKVTSPATIDKACLNVSQPSHICQL